MMRSLTFKWIATLLITSLIGVILVRLFAYRTTVNEFDRLRIEQAEASFVDDVTSYYQTNHSWDGIDSWLHTQESFALPDEADLPPQLWALVDKNGTVVVGSGPFDMGESARPQEIEGGTSIIVDGERVGTVRVAAPQGSQCQCPIQ